MVCLCQPTPEHAKPVDVSVEPSVAPASVPRPEPARTVATPEHLVWPALRKIALPQSFWISRCRSLGVNLDIGQPGNRPSHQSSRRVEGPSVPFRPCGSSLCRRISCTGGRCWRCAIPTRKTRRLRSKRVSIRVAASQRAYWFADVQFRPWDFNADLKCHEGSTLRICSTRRRNVTSVM
jgi:hypothetical protein